MVTAAPAGLRLADVYRPVWQARTYLIAVYLLATGWIGGAWLGIIAGLAGLGIGTIPIYIGVVILAGMPLIWRLGANLERHIHRVVFGTAIIGQYRLAPRASLLVRARITAGDPATWKDLAYLVLLAPLGTIWTAVIATVWAHVLTLIALPAYVHTLPDGRIHRLAFRHWNIAFNTWWSVALAVLVGLVLAAPAAWITRGVGAVQHALARKLLGTSPAQRLAAETIRLRHSRDEIIEAAEAERRRIERNLHDGAQQRLTALAMNLALAARKIDTDPAAARGLVDTARNEAITAIGELRTLARGLNPTTLGEHGLDAALSALAATSPIPITLDIALDPRPPISTEKVLYFVITEALANVAKHAEATTVTVAVADAAGAAANRRIIATIRDDGHGGAHPTDGGGLAGLAARLEAANGTLEISSPPGGPTILTAELPCAS